MVDYIKYTPDLANDWWKTWSYVSNKNNWVENQQYLIDYVF